MSFMTTMLLLMPPIKHLTSVNVILQQGIAAAGSLFRLLDNPLEKDLGQHQVERAHGHVEFKKVSFAYLNAKGNVLHDINFSVEPGQTVALVGRSGSGKSTLVKLLARIYDIDKGDIFLDNIKVIDYKLANLREQMAYVGQDVVLFNDTIGNNIAYGQKTVDEKLIIEAAKAAHAMEFIQRLPNGINTEIGENGVTLSGGERQRLAIARAFLRNAPLLIFDEATSSLDGESAHWVQAGMQRLMHDRTTIIIAHQLATIEKAAKIILMDKGKILDIGNHEELLKRAVNK
jgi:subfamily B ATP-binding cassette protein MsbA